MPKILVFKNTLILRRYLKRYKSGLKTGGKFINFGTLDKESRSLLFRLNFQEVKGNGCNIPSPEEFLKEYVDLIGRIGKKHNSRLWWATDISSKNRFTSKIPFLLQEFLIAAETIKKCECDFLIIMNPSWVIMDSLCAFIRNSGSKFEYFQFPKRMWGAAEILKVHFRAIVVLLFYTLKVFLQSCYSKYKLRHVIRKVLRNKGSYYVVKTFIYDHSFLANGVYRDVFFGDLPEFLRNSRQVLVYTCVSGNFKLCVQNMAGCSNQAILPIEAFLSFKDIVSSLIALLFRGFRVKGEFLFFGYAVSDIINNELLRTANGISFYQFLHYYSAKRLFKSLAADTFLLTYENNPWEKMCILAARKYSPRTTILGYQHTVVPQASANMFISRGEYGNAPVPDRIFTVGSVTKKIIEKYGFFEEGMVKSACGLRFEYLFNARSLGRKKEGNILLALEGIKEAYKLIAYVIRYLGCDEQFKVRIRTHPVFPWEYFQKNYGFKLSGLTNFHLSSEALRADLEWADVVLYWGSTISVEALNMGRPVIHYDTGSMLSYDPLFECPHLKFTANERVDLVELLEKIYSLTDTEFNSAFKKAKEYLSEYFIPVTEINMVGFLEKTREAGIASGRQTVAA